jgi:hypothetical protein
MPIGSPATTGLVDLPRTALYVRWRGAEWCLIPPARSREVRHHGRGRIAPLQLSGGETGGEIRQRFRGSRRTTDNRAVDRASDDDEGVTLGDDVESRRVQAGCLGIVKVSRLSSCCRGLADMAAPLGVLVSRCHAPSVSVALRYR